MNSTQVLSTIRLNPGSKAADFQSANDTLRNQGGGFIELTSGASYVMDAGFIIDTGAGVGIKGNGAVFDFRGLSSGVAINCNARRRNPDNFPIAGYDGAAGNYHQTRGVLEEFSMIGPGKTSTVVAIDIDQSTGTDGVRSPRSNLSKLAIEGFGVGIKHRNEAYAIFGCRVSVFRCGIALSIESGVDSGENSVWDHCMFFNSDLGIDFNTGSDDVAMTFRNCSIDYNVQQIKHTSGYGRVHFYECHFEHNDSSTAIPIDFSAGTGTSNKAIYRFDGGIFVHSGAKSYPHYMQIGQNIRVILTGATQLHNLIGSGIIQGAGKGASGSDIYYSHFAYCSGTGSIFELESATNSYQVDSQNASLPPILSNSRHVNLLGDPSFEQSIVADGWFDVSNTPGSTIGTIAVTNTTSHSGSQCLQIPCIGGSGTSRKLGLFIPVEKLRGRNFSWNFVTRLSGGTGSYFLDIYPVKARQTGATSMTIDHIGSAIRSSAATMSGTDWQKYYLNSVSGREQCPAAWATHIHFRFNLDSVSNNGGSIYFDDFFVTVY